MNNEEYLQQISSSVRPVKAKGGSSILSPKTIKIGLVAIGVVILLSVLGGILGGGKNVTRDRIFELKYRINNTMDVISTYQPYVKSSALRSSSASLHGTLTNVSQDLETYTKEKYKGMDKSTEKKIKEEATLEKDDLDSELFEAKINGVLDRIYAHKMAYEISVIKSKEATISNSTKDENLKLLLDKSITSLDNLYNNFNDFTEGNK